MQAGKSMYSTWASLVWSIEMMAGTVRDDLLDHYADSIPIVPYSSCIGYEL